MSCETLTILPVVIAFGMKEELVRSIEAKFLNGNRDPGQTPPKGMFSDGV